MKTSSSEIVEYYWIIGNCQAFIARAKDIMIEDYEDMCKKKGVENRKGVMDGRQLFGAEFPDGHVFVAIQSGDWWEILSQQKDKSAITISVMPREDLAGIKIIELGLMKANHAVYLRGFHALESDIVASMN